MSKLTWTAGQYNTYQGQASGVRLFAVSWKSRREDPNYLMRSDLPGVYEEWKHDDLDVLKAEAERVLADWLAKVAGPGELLPRPRLTDGHIHQAGAHPGWLGHDGHPVHRHEMSTGRTEWEKP
jgi:hypothetical protein